MSNLIHKFYPDIDSTLILNRLKNGFENQLDIARKNQLKELKMFNLLVVVIYERWA